MEASDSDADPQRDPDRERQTFSTIVIALAAFAGAATAQMLSLEKLDLFLTVAVCCFAFTIPMNCAMWLVISSPKQVDDSSFGSRFMVGMLFLSCLSFLAGLGCLFFHFSLLAGWIFVGSAVFFWFVAMLVIHRGV